MASSILSIPNEYLCPITRDIMTNPVILIEDGCSYEESALQSWLKNHNTSPITNNILSNRNYISNRALKSLINDFLSRQQTSLHGLSQEFLGFNICENNINPDWKHRPIIRLKFTLLGSSGVGKTLLAQSLQYGKWPKYMNFPTATIGTDTLFFYLDKLYRNQYVINIQLNDPSGQERYEAVTNYFFKQCHGALLLTDTTELESFDRIKEYWYPRLKKLGMDHLQSTLVCTKIDLFEKKGKEYRDLFLQRVEEFAIETQMPIVHVSACRGDNVEYLFKQLIIRILKNDILIKDLIDQAIASNDLTSRRSQSNLTGNSISIQLTTSHKSRQQNRKGKSTCCN